MCEWSRFRQGAQLWFREASVALHRHSTLVFRAIAATLESAPCSLAATCSCSRYCICELPHHSHFFTSPVQARDDDHIHRRLFKDSARARRDELFPKRHKTRSLQNTLLFFENETETSTERFVIWSGREKRPRKVCDLVPEERKKRNKIKKQNLPPLRLAEAARLSAEEEPDLAAPLEEAYFSRVWKTPPCKVSLSLSLSRVRRFRFENAISRSGVPRAAATTRRTHRSRSLERLSYARASYTLSLQRPLCAFFKESRPTRR